MPKESTLRRQLLEDPEYWERQPAMMRNAAAAVPDHPHFCKIFDRDDGRNLVIPHGRVIFGRHFFAEASWALAKNAHPSATIYCLDQWARGDTSISTPAGLRRSKLSGPT